MLEEERKMRDRIIARLQKREKLELEDIYDNEKSVETMVTELNSMKQLNRPSMAEDKIIKMTQELTKQKITNDRKVEAREQRNSQHLEEISMEDKIDMLSRYSQKLVPGQDRFIVLLLVVSKWS